MQCSTGYKLELNKRLTQGGQYDIPPSPDGGMWD